MKLLKPPWVNHDGKPIFGIDIHPDGTRFATGGQGDDSGRVIIWNMAPVIHEKDEKDENVPKLLCQMDNHLACVNCVRWSNNGYYLASGGDDRLLMVWKMMGTGTSSVFGSSVSNVEQWKCSHTLRHHTGDVLDVAWSPHDLWLASCSIDNTVIIWNAVKFPEMITVLQGHSGLVKGVSWDPIGKYVASQSDDKSVRIWRTSDWKEETAVFKPFNECGGTTHVLRLCWSPDGFYLVSAHAMNNRGPTAQIIEREGWEPTMDFVGHRKAVTCVRFHNSIFTKPSKKSTIKAHNYSICAIGSRDRAISIWMTSLKRPLVVIHDLFSNSVMDVSWSLSGGDLLACSWDGTVCYCQFDMEEIGRQLTLEERNKIHEGLYGKRVLSKSLASNTIIENPAMLQLLQQQKEMKEEQEAAKQKVVHNTPTKRNLPANSVMEGQQFDVKRRQIETRTKDGRRRITPIFIAPQQGPMGPPAPFTTHSNSAFSLSENKEESSTAFKENTDKAKTIKQEIPEKAQDHIENTGPDKVQKPPSALDSRFTERAKTPTTTPVTARTDGASGFSKETPFTTPVTVHVPRRKEPEPTPTSSVTPVTALPVAAAASASTPPVIVKRSRGRPPGSGRAAAQAAAAASAAAAAAAAARATPPGPQVVTERDTSRLPRRGLQLPTPSVNKTISTQVTGKQAAGEGKVTIEVDNEVNAGRLTIQKLRCIKSGQTVWETILTSKALSLVANSNIICVSCEDKTLGVYSPSGRRLLPSLVLPSVGSSIKIRGYHIMAISTCGKLFVWDVRNQQAIVNKVSLETIIEPSISISKSLLTDQGVGVIGLSNGKSYMYSNSMCCWLLIDQKEDILRLTSDHQPCQPAQTPSHSGGPLSHVQGTQQRPGNQTRSMFPGNHNLQKAATLTHLENQVSAALALKSPKEYRFWILTYARYLVQEECEGRLRELCNDLLGPFYQGDQEEGGWQSSILGLSKRGLLKDILPILGTNLKLQRLYSEYEDQLEMAPR
ncbi:protein HIRA-like [Lytechinus pictus]|uniref:protein HIRA-like n=1 Tax=Lytechinus pictus TaxID=7653 RepID=UPI0030BA12FD